MRVKAQLVTACGCKREIDTTFPPPPKIMLLLKPKMSAMFHPATQDLPNLPLNRTRTFVLRDKGHSLISTEWWAEYHEEV